MSLVRRSLAIVLAGAACLACLGLAPAAAAGAARAPARLLVYAQEWSLWPSRSWVPAGTVIVQLWNRGQDAHDLRIRRQNTRGQMFGPVLDGVRITLSGQVRQATWHLT